MRSEQEFVIRWAVDNVSKLDEKGRNSKIHYFADLPWYLHVYRTPEYTSHLTVLLHCNEECEEKEWICEQRSTIRLLHSSGDSDCDVTRKTAESFAHKYSYTDPIDLIEWTQLIDPEKGFIEDDNVTIKVRIEVKNVKGIKKLRNFDFTSPAGQFDLILRVEGKEIHVGRQYLAAHSPVFTEMLCDDARQGNADIELKNVKCEEFIDLLHIVYPSGRAVNFQTFEFTLALARAFEIKFALEQVESYLIRSRRLKLHEKIKLADQHRLEQLKNDCLQKFKTVKQVKTMNKHLNLESLSESLQAECFNRLMELPLK